MRSGLTLGDTARFFRFREGLDAVSERGEVPALDLRLAFAAGGADSVIGLEVGWPGAARTPVDRAFWQLQAGDRDAAFRDLNQAVDERNVWLAVQINLPYFAPLAADQRFAAIKRRMGLPQP